MVWKGFIRTTSPVHIPSEYSLRFSACLAQSLLAASSLCCRRAVIRRLLDPLCRRHHSCQNHSLSRLSRCHHSFLSSKVEAHCAIRQSVPWSLPVLSCFYPQDPAFERTPSLSG